MWWPTKCAKWRWKMWPPRRWTRWLTWRWTRWPTRWPTWRWTRCSRHGGRVWFAEVISRVGLSVTNFYRGGAPGFYAGYFSITGDFKQSDKSKFEVLIPPFCPAAVCDPPSPPDFSVSGSSDRAAGGGGSVPRDFCKFSFPYPNKSGARFSSRGKF